VSASSLATALIGEGFGFFSPRGQSLDLSLTIVSYSFDFTAGFFFAGLFVSETVELLS